MSAQGVQDRPRNDRLLVRFIVFGVIIAVVVTTLTARLAYLQFTNGGYYHAAAADNYVVFQAVPSTRGLIVDRAGRTLVRNVPSFAVKVRPADLPYDKRDGVVSRLSALLRIPTTKINETIDENPGSRFDLVRIASGVPENVAHVISEEHLDLPGVEVVVEAMRQYPYADLVAQILGYTGPIDADELRALKGKDYQVDDTLGKAGVELSYESVLRGAYGTEEIERDASGREIQVLATPVEPVPGSTIQLSIDVKIQKEAQTALQWGIQAAGLKRGVMIVMNPQTGEVLAMVSLPTYDDNLFAQGISNADYQKYLSDPGQPLLNHAIAENYPPGSTYKLVTGTAGLADGRITPTTTIQTAPYLELAGQRFNEWNGAGFGPLNVTGGYAESSDTIFYQLAAMVGIDRLGYWGKQYGFGAPTGIDLPGEASGTVPTNAWKQQTFGQDIFPGETYLSGIGQGYDFVTPIQLITAYCALANGGKLYRPQIVRQILNPDGTVQKAFKPRLIRKLPVDPSILTTMREAAREAVVIRHTGNLVDMPLYVAGKTGTAEYGTQKIGGNLPFDSWFVGFVSPSGNFAKTDSQLAVLAFTYDTSNSLGNPSTELVKYFLQMHYGIKQDFRNLALIVPGSGN